MKKVSNFKVATTYANAIYETSDDKHCLQDVYNDIKLLEQLNSDVFCLLKKVDTPLLKNKEKEQLVEAFAMKMRLKTDVVNILKLLAQNNKMFLLPNVVERFLHLYNQRHNIAEVLVTTAIKLNARQEKNLIKKLAALFNKDILLKYIIDPDIIGGLIIQHETYLIDMSIRYKLSSLEQIMKGSK